ncbi:lysophospholipid acyltransferase family protein [Phytoactinopolyspora mesophila]|uniref:1-acyl-sn-glycerol-3-phosphate acyltransferase n=1 Tax=Phytoactinopolyspora mesophila TaxID=2650750 RepID=A0A7K3MDT7_9ACTN|nr:lysophospholipid acyltransferase family protein [Phytoactinopolyspora mesophila]NDL60578.1 1-acyl-sn-glycerol-3-phosphate acyltransferase [Phytoactinopolyspora mesophila]
MTVAAAPDYWHDVPGPRARAARAARPLASALVRSAFKVRLHNFDVIPAGGPVILASNHTSILDGPLLYALVKRPVHALVKQEMFAGPAGVALRAIGQIPVDRFACDPVAVKDCLAVLHRGDVLAIYPEGTRGPGGFEQIKPGVAYLALCTGAPVVPVAALGCSPAPGSAKGLPRLRTSIDVVAGAPIQTRPVPWPRRRDMVRERADELADSLRDHVRHACALTGRELPGVRGAS